jgi:phage/plasmid-associated DNA primase
VRRGAILSWIIEGARRVIAKDYRISQPKVVSEAIRRYRENNDWLSQFLEESCEVDRSYSARSGEFYNAYRSYCMQVGEYIRSTTDFYTAIEQAGFERKRSKSGATIMGVRLKSDFLKD